MIIAVDFDGVLCTDEFPSIGKPNYDVINITRQLIDKGHEVILWTSRVEEALDEAVAWCHDRGLHFCAINDNAPSNKERYKGIYSTAPRKVYADVYVDDHNVAIFVDKNEYKVRNMTAYMKQLFSWRV